MRLALAWSVLRGASLAGRRRRFHHRSDVAHSKF